jgi:hypothetical protein
MIIARLWVYQCFQDRRSDTQKTLTRLCVEAKKLTKACATKAKREEKAEAGKRPDLPWACSVASGGSSVLMPS